MKIAFVSFGCKVNQAEINSLIEELKGYDASVEANPANADIVIVNTCAVTGKAQKDGEKYLRSLKNKNPDMRLVATGCLAELLKNDLAYIGVDSVVLNKFKKDIISLLNLKRRRDEIKKPDQTRAFIKIQDGCDCNCTYCIIPSLRGTPVSVPEEDVISMILKSLNDGYKEIVLTGIHIGLYGKENGSCLNSLLEKVCGISGDFRVRLSSLYVQEINSRLIDNVANSNGRLAPHFHISLQSASHDILKMMGRTYDPTDCLNVIRQIRDKIPHAFLGADIIAGFPGETDELFNETLGFLENLPVKYQFDSMHIFPYSERPGTPAASSSSQNSEQIRKNRAAKLRQIALVQSDNRKKMMVGTTARVLSEKGDKGHTDNYFLIKLPDNTSRNRFWHVRIEYGDNGELKGVITGS